MRPTQRPPSVVLGVHAFGHDAAAALLVDGVLVFAASEERYDRRRFSAAFPARAIAAALGHAGLAPADVDLVAFPWTRGMARGRKALHVLRGLPRSLAFLREPPDHVVGDRRGYLRAMASLPARLREAGLRAPVVRVPHHVAHAASAALVLPDATGAVVTADGMGEWTTAATWHVVRGRPVPLQRATYPHSAGKAYAAVTSWLGFVPEADEGKTMGLAAYGDPAAPAAAFGRSLLAPHPTRLLTVDLARFGFPWGEARLFGDAFVEALGPPRPPDAPLRPGDADLARGAQDAVEAFALGAARSALAATGAGVVGLAGGLFLNCRMNGRLARELPAAVHPFPVAGDAGAAVGAAAWAHVRATGRPAAPLTTLRLGDAPRPEEVAAALGADDPGPTAPDALLDAVAACIDAGNLVGVCRGRGEAGPRALGGRSVLARADDPAVRDRLNRHKGREAWRPVAPVLAAEDVGRWFEPAWPSPWMILTLTARPAARTGPLRGAVHVDGTARVQTVTADGEPFLHGLLRRLAPHGHAAVLNTSLNRRGEPIVRTAAEALAAARASRLDALVLEDRLVRLSPGAG